MVFNYGLVLPKAVFQGQINVGKYGTSLYPFIHKYVGHGTYLYHRMAKIYVPKVGKYWKAQTVREAKARLSCAHGNSYNCAE